MLRYNGVPSSLNVISKKVGDGGPLLQPYPDWSFAKYDDCSGIVSASKLAVIEHCDYTSSQFIFLRKRRFICYL